MNTYNFSEMSLWTLISNGEERNGWIYHLINHEKNTVEEFYKKMIKHENFKLQCKMNGMVLILKESDKHYNKNHDGNDHDDNNNNNNSYNQYD